MKTAGQAAYECRDRQAEEIFGSSVAWDNLTAKAKQAWEEVAQAARDWQPEKEKTLGEVAWNTYHRTPPDVDNYMKWEPSSVYAPSWQAAGEACAKIGAEREREWFRQWAIDNFDYDVPFTKEMFLAALDARGKEQQP